MLAGLLFSQSGRRKGFYQLFRGKSERASVSDRILPISRFFYGGRMGHMKRTCVFLLFLLLLSGCVSRNRTEIESFAGETVATVNYLMQEEQIVLKNESDKESTSTSELVQSSTDEPNLQIQGQPTETNAFQNYTSEPFKHATATKTVSPETTPQPIKSPYPIDTTATKPKQTKTITKTTTNVSPTLEFSNTLTPLPSVTITQKSKESLTPSSEVTMTPTAYETSTPLPSTTITPTYIETVTSSPEVTITPEPSLEPTPNEPLEWEGEWQIWYQNTKGLYVHSILTLQRNNQTVTGSATIEGVEYRFAGTIYEQNQVVGEYYKNEWPVSFHWFPRSQTQFSGAWADRFGFCGNKTEAVQPENCRYLPPR